MTQDCPCSLAHCCLTVSPWLLAQVDVLPEMRKSLMAMCKLFHTSVESLSLKFLTLVRQTSCKNPVQH